MKRSIPFAILAVAIASFSSVRSADVVVAPPPRESGEAAPTAAAKKENPRETVDRIIKNSNAVGDKLAESDTGKDTQKTQDKILKDIQSLIDQQENPPPQSNQNDPNQNDMDKDKNQQKDPNDKGDMQKQDMQPNGGMDQQPMGGSDQPTERRPRQQAGGQSQQKDSKSQPMGQGSGASQAGKDPGKGGGGSGGASKSPKQEKGQAGGPLPNPMHSEKLPPSTPSLPPEEAVLKDVWGSLPDKKRQQLLQSYDNEHMPRYAKLLEYYNSSLADKAGKK